MFSSLQSELLTQIQDFFIRSVPFSVPLILGVILYFLWTYYIRLDYLSKKDWVLLEIRLPRDIQKPPRAMEIVLGSLVQTYEGTWLSRLTKGVLRTWFSLEMVSIGGNVHFFIRTDRLFKNMIEAQIYAQYPGVEIYEAEDYTMGIHYDRDKTIKLWGAELGLDKPDPYPIKTYVDYKLDETGAEEEQKTDPLTPTIEFLGSLSEGEQAWIQILVMGSRKKTAAREHEAKEIIDKIMKREVKEHSDVISFASLAVSPGERAIAEAIERSLAKPALDCGIRMIYMAPVDKYSLGNQLGLKNCFKQYTSHNLNGFTQIWDTTYDFPWQDPFGNRALTKREKAIEHYRARTWFYFPHVHHPYLLNTEELATIYHFPGGVATTPLIGRIPSRKGEPPPNLPI